MSILDQLSQAFSAELDQYARYKGDKTPSLFDDAGNASWDETKHPRVEKGSKVSHGGQFTSQHGPTPSENTKPKQLSLFEPQLLGKPAVSPVQPEDEEKPEHDLEAMANEAVDGGGSIWAHAKSKGLGLIEMTNEQRKQYAEHALKYRSSITKKPTPISPARAAAQAKFLERNKPAPEVESKPESAEVQQSPSPGSQSALSRVAGLADSFERRARTTEHGNGLAVGSGEIDARWKADALRGMSRDIQGGMSVNDAENKWKAESRKWIAAHNARRPKDINWARWDGAVDSTLETASRMLRQDVKQPEATSESSSPGSTEATPEPVAKSPADSIYIPLRERKGIAQKLADNGKTLDEIESHLTSRGVAKVDAKKLAIDAKGRAPESDIIKGAQESADWLSKQIGKPVHVAKVKDTGEIVAIDDK